MCLAVVLWQPGAAVPLKGVANRDEFRARPTAPLARWQDAPILAGRDLEAGGTWLGFGTGGRFGLLTNLRCGPPERGRRSRGELVVRYLREGIDPMAFCAGIASQMSEYAGFNLLLGSPGELVVCSTARPSPLRLGPGVHALSNAPPDTDWPKCRLAAEQMRLQHPLMEADLDRHAILGSRAEVAPPDLPDTGVGEELERRLSAQTITGEDYGTRSRTHWLLAADGVFRVREQQLDAAGAVLHCVTEVCH
jgi:uncharacterized protein with NRDE domain